jgi:hypothetical protein
VFLDISAVQTIDLLLISLTKIVLSVHSYQKREIDEKVTAGPNYFGKRYDPRPLPKTQTGHSDDVARPGLGPSRSLPIALAVSALTVPTMLASRSTRPAVMQLSCLVPRSFIEVPPSFISTPNRCSSYSASLEHQLVYLSSYIFLYHLLWTSKDYRIVQRHHCPSWRRQLFFPHVGSRGVYRPHEAAVSITRVSKAIRSAQLLAQERSLIK